MGCGTSHHATPFCCAWSFLSSCPLSSDPRDLAQEVPGGLSLPRVLPPGIPDEQQYVRMYCEARGLPYPLQASLQCSLQLAFCTLCAATLRCAVMSFGCLAVLLDHVPVTALFRCPGHLELLRCTVGLFGLVPHPVLTPAAASLLPPLLTGQLELLSGSQHLPPGFHSGWGWRPRGPGQRLLSHRRAGKAGMVCLENLLVCEVRHGRYRSLVPEGSVPLCSVLTAPGCPHYGMMAFDCRRCRSTPLQMGAESVVRSLARRGLEVVGLLPPSASSRTAVASSSSSAWSSSAARSPTLMGTPLEPYANPTHPSARPDTTPNILAGNPLEEYANPSPQWQQAASAAAAALAQADAQLPSSSASSIRGSNGSSGSGGGGNSRTAAAVAGASGQTSGLGPSARVQPLLQRLKRFMEEHVYPAGQATAAVLLLVYFCCVTAGVCPRCDAAALLCVCMCLRCLRMRVTDGIQLHSWRSS